MDKWRSWGHNRGTILHIFKELHPMDQSAGKPKDEEEIGQRMKRKREEDVKDGGEKEEQREEKDDYHRCWSTSQFFGKFIG